MKIFLTLMLWFGFCCAGLLIILGAVYVYPSFEKPKYEIAVQPIIPDSLKSEQAHWIQETVRAASQNTMTGRVTNPERILEVTQKISIMLFARPCDGLLYNDKFIPYNSLTIYQKNIFDSIIVKK